MAGKARFEVYFSNRARQYSWRLRAPNNRIIAVAGEMFKKREGAINGIRSVKINASKGGVVAAKVSKFGLDRIGVPIHKAKNGKNGAPKHRIKVKRKVKVRRKPTKPQNGANKGLNVGAKA